MARRPSKRMTPMRYPLSQEVRYRQILRKLVREMRHLCNEHFVPHLERWAAGSMIVQDADDDWLDQINKALERITKGMVAPVRITQRQLDEIGVGTDSFNQKEWTKLIRKAYGVNPTKDKQYDAKLQNWADTNAALIKNIPERTINEIREVAIEALIDGTSIKDTAKAVKEAMDERIDVSDSRATFIARDQVAKLNGDLTRSRQEDAGVDRYRWTTVGDERVRKSHEEVDGREFTWDAPPVEVGFHPGLDFQCRCWAEPILKERMAFEASLLDADELEDA